MDNISLNLIVLAVLALVGGSLFILVRQMKAGNEEQIVRLAGEQGWRYESIREPLAWGIRLASAQWTLEALSRSSGRETGAGSSDIGMSTIWQADAPGSTVLIGERTSQANLGSIGNMLTRQVLQLALGRDADGLIEIQTGSEAFHQKYMVWAQDRTEAGDFLTPGLESALLGWKGEKPIIKRTSSGLTIELRGVRLQKAGALCALVRLGGLFL